MNSVFKYFPSDRASFLEDGLIRFSPPGALNDPYECLPALSDELEQVAVDYLRRDIARDFSPSPFDDRNARRIKAAQLKVAMDRLDKKFKKAPGFFREQFFKHTSDSLDKNLGILSLSRRWNSALMWSHYTSSYTGYCVGFKRDHAFFDGVHDPDGERFPLSPVRYSEHRTLIQKQRLSHSEAINLILTKSLDWSYEEEERLVSFLRFADVVIELSPLGLHLFKVPFEAVSELIVGHRASPEVKAKISAAAKRFGVKAYETKISNSSFDVEKKLLNFK